MAKVKKTKKKSELAFYKKLLLNQYILKQFGAENLKDISSNMKNPILENIDSEGVTGFSKQLILTFEEKSLIKSDKLIEYDLNIVSHLQKINYKRDNKISLKYFQYLSLIFVEYYIDQYFNNKEGLLTGLNAHVEEFNENNPNDKIDKYEEEQLNKIALWNATGSGKTLLMHINYYQYLYYAGKISDDSTLILLTPRESLSMQHLENFAESDIPAKIYSKEESRYFADKNEINILENTKLDDKDGDKRVSVNRFGDKNVVFVDEGHRGSSGDTWHTYRNRLCENGFSFEYSATFGQAVKASGKSDLLQEYAKCITFDYSYKFFHKDGYGKDYNIINLNDDSNEHIRSLYLTACLMTYYQQKKLYLTRGENFVRFNIENPLFIFVGSSVTAKSVRTESGKKVSDVLDILIFFQNFVKDEKTFMSFIEQIISGNAGILDKNNREIFRESFNYLKSEYNDAKSTYLDIINTVFNCNTVGATLHIENLKGINGEISIRLGDNSPFGVINVSDDSELLKLCSEFGFHTDSIDFGESLFDGINNDNSTINLLIGSKKFNEGWNCWRVSTMGLMNIGRKEGSEIIQLFGRGVRLKGLKMSLKRSSALSKDIPNLETPKHINLLETLNVFGVRADYMKQFNEFLKEEGVPTENEPPLIIELPVINNPRYKEKNLYNLKIKDNKDFRKHGPKPCLTYSDKIEKVVLDCYAKVQFETSKNTSGNEISKKSNSLGQEQLAFLDYDNIYFELLKYKNEKLRYNINIRKADIIDLLDRNDWYTLLIPDEELKIKRINDCKKFGKIAISLLIKYCEKFYYSAKSKWEEPLLKLLPIKDDDENFLNENKYTISIFNEENNMSYIIFIDKLIKYINEAIGEDTLVDFAKKNGALEAVAFSSNLYNPVLYLEKSNEEAYIKPIALNESEIKFIKDLRDYIKNTSEYFKDKEVYIIRNKSKKGIGFFEEKKFFPDFIMWLLTDDKQYITFIEPHGARNMSIADDKINLHTRIKNIKLDKMNVVLNSFIITPTKHSDLIEKYIPKETWENKNVLFMDNKDYIKLLFEKIK